MYCTFKSGDTANRSTTVDEKKQHDTQCTRSSLKAPVIQLPAQHITKVEKAKSMNAGKYYEKMHNPIALVHKLLEQIELWEADAIMYNT